MENGDNVTAVYIRHGQCNGTVGARIPALKGAEIVESFTLCFRFMIKHWWFSMILLETPDLTLKMNNYELADLNLFIHGRYYDGYNWKQALSLSASTWNSLCLSYNSPMKRIKLSLNGMLLADFTEDSTNGAGFFNFSYVEIGKKSFFEGFYTDIYIWNITLTNVEIFNYSIRHNTTFIVNEKAEVLKWSEAKLIVNSSCTKLTSLATKSVSIHNPFHRRKYYFTLVSVDFESTKKFCGQINGELFYPQTLKTLQLVLNEEEKISSMKCNYAIWTPFQKDTNHSKEWIFGKKWQKQQKQSFDPLSFDNKLDGTCLYLNVSAKEIYSSDCNEKLCAVCEIDQERLLFSLQTERQANGTNPEINYILSEDEDGELIYTGVTGIWKFGFGMFFLFHYERAEKIFAMVDNFAVGPGILNWNVVIFDDPNMTLGKLTNVSLLLDKL